MNVKYLLILIIYILIHYINYNLSCKNVKLDIKYV